VWIHDADIDLFASFCGRQRAAQRPVDLVFATGLLTRVVRNGHFEQQVVGMPAQEDTRRGLHAAARDDDLLELRTLRSMTTARELQAIRA
jgi:hypothetical protein